MLLCTAAWMDFSNYVRSLLHAGRTAEARLLWESVVEVIHNGTNPNLEVLGIPRSCLGCADSPARSHHVCDVIPGEEAFSSLSLVSGPGRLFWPEQVIRPSLYGNGTMQAGKLLSYCAAESGLGRHP